VTQLAARDGGGEVGNGTCERDPGAAPPRAETPRHHRFAVVTTASQRLATPALPMPKAQALDSHMGSHSHMGSGAAAL